MLETPKSRAAELELSYGRNADDSCKAVGGGRSSRLSSLEPAGKVGGGGWEIAPTAAARRGEGRVMVAGVVDEPTTVEAENAVGGDAICDGGAESLSDEMLGMELPEFVCYACSFMHYWATLQNEGG